MATAAPAAPEGTEEAPKKKKPILLIAGIAVGAIVLLVGVVFGTLFFSGYFEKKAEMAAMEKLDELEAAATKARDEAPVKIKKEAPQETRFEKNYMQMDKELMTNITGSKKVMVIQVALMDVLRQTTDAELARSDYRKNLADKLKAVMNEVLEKNEDFGGIEDVFFTSFVVQ
jgi:flagellar FliL protein